MEPVTLRREARFLEQPDEPRQLPERHRLGRGKAVADLVDREMRRKARLLEGLRRAVRRPARAFEHAPGAVLQDRLLRLDPARELIRAAKEEERDALERILAGRDP